MEWISVKDSLPEGDVEVLATNGKYMRVAHMEPSYEEERFWTYYDYMEWHSVTHWMPLPSLPIIYDPLHPDEAVCYPWEN